MRLKLATELATTLTFVAATADMRPTRQRRRFIATAERANLQRPRMTALATSVLELEVNYFRYSLSHSAQIIGTYMYIYVLYVMRAVTYLLQICANIYMYYIKINVFPFCRKNASNDYML